MVFAESYVPRKISSGFSIMPFKKKRRDLKSVREEEKKNIKHFSKDYNARKILF